MFIPYTPADPTDKFPEIIPLVSPVPKERAVPLIYPAVFIPYTPAGPTDKFPEIIPLVSPVPKKRDFPIILPV